MEVTNHTKKNGHVDMNMKLKEKYEELAHELQEAISENKKAVDKTIAHTAKDVQKAVKKNPWPYIGAASVAALLLGFALGRKK